MSKKYRIELTPEERKELEELVNRGKVSALKQRHGRILLQADDNQPGGAATNAEVAQAVGVDISTVERVRRAFVFHGLDGRDSRMFSNSSAPWVTCVNPSGSSAAPVFTGAAVRTMRARVKRPNEFRDWYIR